MSQEGSGQGGSTRRHPESSSNSGKGCSSRKALVRSQAGPGAGLPYTTRPTFSQRSLHSSSVFSSCGVLGCLFLDCAFLPVWPSTRLVAPTEQLARGRGSWDVEGARLRVQQDASAERLVTQNIMVATWIWSICKVEAPRSCGG